MKHLFLALVFISVTTITLGQNKSDFRSNNLIVIHDEIFSQSSKNGIDTLYPPSITLPCAQSLSQLVIITLNSSEWMFGCNSNFDTEAAQIYNIGSNSMDISKVICWMQKMGMAGSMYAKIYAVDPITNKPTTLLGTSDPFLNSSLPINPTILQRAEINFSQPIHVTGKIAVSIQFFCVLNQGSAMGLASTSNGCTVSNAKNSWIKDSNGIWFSSQEYVSGNTPLLTDLFILPVGYYATSLEENVDNSNVCFPNPAHDMIAFNIKISQPNGTIEIYNSIGKQIDQINWKENETMVNIKTYSSGSYYYVIKNNLGEVISKGKFIKI